MLLPNLTYTFTLCWFQGLSTTPEAVCNKTLLGDLTYHSISCCISSLSYIIQSDWSGTPWRKLSSYILKKSRCLLMDFLISTNHRENRCGSLTYMLYALLFTTASLHCSEFTLHILPSLPFQQGISFIYTLRTKLPCTFACVCYEAYHIFVVMSTVL